LKKCTPQNRCRRLFGKRLRERVDRQAGRVAREYRMLAEMRRHFAIEIGLPVHALGNRLDHDVAFLEQIEVLVVIGGLDQGRLAHHRQRAGLELFKVVDRLKHIAVRIAVLRGQFEQQRFDIGVDQMRGNLRAHDSGTEDGCLAHDKRSIRLHPGPLQRGVNFNTPDEREAGKAPGGHAGDEPLIFARTNANTGWKECRPGS
jgi:hypothetical protein